MLIGELARTAGTTVRALRYYEQNGLLPARRSANGYRDYPATAVTRVRNIRRLLGLGLTATEIRHFRPCLDDEYDETRSCPESVSLIARKLAATEARLAEMSTTRELLARELRRAAAH
ncbi:MerR family transcriptional regulator [Amycolatopsis nigrescens]|uniref:MerR family transcriptional regulator n=1 Tax=Amycolatopsis nigrescens TaxID=381445 RepID=UPI0003760438|nr:MerR family transcriptional regulator [Amycolatopsis nigrescens]